MRLYKMKITGYPAEAILRVDIDDEAMTRTTVLKSGWVPEGWKEYIDEMADGFGQSWAQRAREEGYRFFWPSEKRTYKTKESAESKVWAVRKWGGTAVVLVAEVGEFVDVEEVKRRQKEAKDLARAEKLRAKATELLQQAKELGGHIDDQDWV